MNDLNYIAQELAKYGRHGDDHLVHMSGRELAGLNAVRPLTKNPITGMPEAFSFGDILGPILGIATMIAAPEAAPWLVPLVSGAGTAIGTGDINKGIMSGLLSYGLGGLSSGFGGIGQSAADSAEAAAAVDPAQVAEGASSDAARGFLGSGAQAYGMADPAAQAATQMAPAATPTDLGMGQKINNIYNGIQQPGAIGQVLSQHPFATGAAAIGGLGLLGSLGSNNIPTAAATGAPSHVSFLPPANRKPAMPPPSYVPGISPEFNYFAGQTPQSGSQTPGFDGGGQVQSSPGYGADLQTLIEMQQLGLNQPEQMAAGGIAGLPGGTKTWLLPPRRGPGMAKGGDPNDQSSDSSAALLASPMLNTPQMAMSSDMTRGMSPDEVMSMALATRGTSGPMAQAAQAGMLKQMVQAGYPIPNLGQQSYASGGDLRENWDPSRTLSPGEMRANRAALADPKMEFQFTDDPIVDPRMPHRPFVDEDNAMKVRRALIEPYQGIHRAHGGTVGADGGDDRADNVIAEARAALQGEHPHPAQALERFVDQFGEDALRQLRASMSLKGGGMVKGAGDGMADLVPGTIEGKEPVQLANDEFVVPADVVSHLGNGSSEHGSRLLHEMMDRVRKDRTGTSKQAPRIDGHSYLPA